MSKGQAKMTVDKYLMICHEMGTTPSQAKIDKLDPELAYEVELALFLYSMLGDRWDGSSGVYMGKSWESLYILFDIYEVESRQEILYLMKSYEIFSIDAAENRRKAAEKRNKARNG